MYCNYTWQKLTESLCTFAWTAELLPDTNIIFWFIQGQRRREMRVSVYSDDDSYSVDKGFGYHAGDLASPWQLIECHTLMSGRYVRADLYWVEPSITRLMNSMNSLFMAINLCSTNYFLLRNQYNWVFCWQQYFVGHFIDIHCNRGSCAWC